MGADDETPRDSDEVPWIVRLVDAQIDQRWSEAQYRASTLRRQSPGANADRLANELIDDGAFWAGLVGIGMGAASSIPALGQYIALGTVSPELLYLTRLQFDTALAIAAIYERDLPKETLKPTLLACLAYSMGHEFVKSILAEAVTNLSRRAIEQALRQSTLTMAKRIARQLGVAVTKKGLLKMVPLVVIPINAAMNYGGLVLFGKMAKHFFSPNWLMCAGCGHIQPRRNRFCSSCGATIA